MTTLQNASSTSDLDTSKLYLVPKKRNESLVLLTGHYIKNKQLEDMSRYQIQSNNGKDYSITNIPIPHPFFEYKFWGIKHQRMDYNCTRFTVLYSAWVRQSHITIRDIESLFTLIFENSIINKYMGCDHAPWMTDIDNYLLKSAEAQKDYKVKIDELVAFLKSFKELFVYRYVKLFVWHFEISYLCHAKSKNIDIGAYYPLDEILKLPGDKIEELYNIITSVPFNLCITSYNGLYELNLEQFDMATKECIDGKKRTREDEFHRRVVEIYNNIKESTWTDGQCVINKYIAMPDINEEYEDALQFLVQNKIVILRRDDIILPIIDFWEQSICESLRELFFNTINGKFFFLLKNGNILIFFLQNEIILESLIQETLRHSENMPYAKSKDRHCK